MNRKIMTQPSLFLSRRYARYLVCASTQAGLTAAFGSLFFVFWALFFLTEPYKFALYPTFSFLVLLLFQKTARNFAVVNISVI